MAKKDKRKKNSQDAQDNGYQQRNYNPDGYRPGSGYGQNYNPGGYPQGGSNGYRQGYNQGGQGYHQGYDQGGQGYNQGYQQGYGPGGYQNGPYDNGYYEQEERRRRTEKRKKKRRRTFIIEILVLLILAAGLFVAAKVGKIKRTDVSKGDIVINDAVDLDGYTNIALFGVDSREGSLDKDAHSDTLMVASINNKTKDVKLVSVYRDTYLDNTNGEYRKATECYYFGGPSRAISMLNKNLDLNITDFVTVDFTAVADVVDALGGIEVDVQEDEIVHLNNYQVEGSQVTGKEIVPVEYAGLQTLNGLQALSYCRIRYTEGSDFKRTERQRTVLSRILEKAKSADLLTLNNLIDQIASNMLTSLSNTELLSLAKDVAAYNLTEQTGFPFDLTTANLSAGDCVVPINLEDNVRQLHQWMFGEENYQPSSTVQEISWQIINDTGIQ